MFHPVPRSLSALAPVLLGAASLAAGEWDNAWIGLLSNRSGQDLVVRLTGVSPDSGLRVAWARSLSHGYVPGGERELKPEAPPGERQFRVGPDEVIRILLDDTVAMPETHAEFEVEVPDQGRVFAFRMASDFRGTCQAWTKATFEHKGWRSECEHGLVMLYGPGKDDGSLALSHAGTPLPEAPGTMDRPDSAPGRKPEPLSRDPENKAGQDLRAQRSGPPGFPFVSPGFSKVMTASARLLGRAMFDSIGNRSDVPWRVEFQPAPALLILEPGRGIVDGSRPVTLPPGSTLQVYQEVPDTGKDPVITVTRDSDRARALLAWKRADSKELCKGVLKVVAIWGGVSPGTERSASIVRDGGPGVTLHSQDAGPRDGSRESACSGGKVEVKGSASSGSGAGAGDSMLRPSLSARPGQTSSPWQDSAPGSSTRVSTLSSATEAVFRQQGQVMVGLVANLSGVPWKLDYRPAPGLLLLDPGYRIVDGRKGPVALAPGSTLHVHQEVGAWNPEAHAIWVVRSDDQVCARLTWETGPGRNLLKVMEVRNLACRSEANPTGQEPHPSGIVQQGALGITLNPPNPGWRADQQAHSSLSGPGTGAGQQNGTPESKDGPVQGREAGSRGGRPSGSAQQAQPRTHEKEEREKAERSQAERLQAEAARPDRQEHQVKPGTPPGGKPLLE